jgi:hypothetical protein
LRSLVRASKSVATRGWDRTRPFGRRLYARPDTPAGHIRRKAT